MSDKKYIPRGFRDNRIGGYVSARYGPGALRRPRRALRHLIID